MPSSHSSSSHSSFSGGSSFGGSSFHSSPSLHSYSSHSSSWSSSSSSHLSRSESSPSPRSYERTERYEPKPPTQREIHAGDSNIIFNILLLHYLFRNEEERRKKHYTYHPRAFTDKYGHENKAGYYDEDTGRCCENMVMPGIRNIVTCPQCRAQHFHTWESPDNAVTCPFCDHRFIVPDEADGEYVKETEKLTPEARWKDFKAKAFDILPTVFGAIIVVILIAGFIVGGVTLVDYLENRPVETTTTRVVSGSLNTIYVEPIGRECSFDGENYYDEESNMYFWYNTDISPAQWQYWYEPISGQYGDYGWMEYDDSEQRWYIEASSGTWVKYEGDTSAMWHFDNAFIGPETMVVAAVDPDQKFITCYDSCQYSNMDPGTYVITVVAIDTETNEVVATKEVTVRLENREGKVDLEYEVPASTRTIQVQYTLTKQTDA